MKNGPLSQLSHRGWIWIQLNFNQNFNQRLTKFTTNDTSRYKFGKNMMSNRLKVINNEIELDDLNRSFNSFKVLMKKKYLQPL